MHEVILKSVYRDGIDNIEYSVSSTTKFGSAMGQCESDYWYRPCHDYLSNALMQEKWGQIRFWFCVNFCCRGLGHLEKYCT